MQYTEDQRWAIQFLRETEGHSCYVCRGGEADCGTINARDDAWALLREAKSVPVVVMDEDFPF